ncbi:MAG: EamA family transporter [Actinomycetes bacterium]
MSVVLALVAAASWGTSDFLGGLAGRRRADEVTVSFGAQVVGLVGFALLALLLPGGELAAGDLPLAAGAGVAGAVGVTLLYRGLTVGTMGVVAPITGAGAATIPVLWGATRGEVPGPVGWVGIVAAIAAIVLVSRTPAPADGTPPARTAGLWEAVGSGLGFGAVFVLLDALSVGSGLLALVPMKLVAALLLGVLLLARRVPAVPPAGARLPLLGVGVLDNAANLAYLFATRAGLLAAVAVISSLYPVGTVLLARRVLGEHLTRTQVAGLGLALTGVVLLAVG